MFATQLLPYFFSVQYLYTRGVKVCGFQNDLGFRSIDFSEGGGSDEEKKQQRQKQETYNTVKKTMYLIQMYLLANMSCVGGGVGAAGGSKAQGSGRRHNNSSESEMRSEKDEFDHQFKLKLNKLSKTVDTVIQLNSELVTFFHINSQQTWLLFSASNSSAHNLLQRIVSLLSQLKAFVDDWNLFAEKTIKV